MPNLIFMNEKSINSIFGIFLQFNTRWRFQVAKIIPFFKCWLDCLLIVSSTSLQIMIYADDIDLTIIDWKKQGKELKSSIPQKIPETDISSQLSLHSSWDDTYYRSKNISYSDQIHKKLKPSTNIPSSLDTEPTLLLINSAYWQCRHLAVEICNARHLSCFQASYSTTQLFFYGKGQQIQI